MKKIFFVIIVLTCLLEPVKSQNRTVGNWVKMFCSSSDLVTEAAQNRKIRSVLLSSLNESSMAWKKALRQMEITPTTILKITDRFPTDEVKLLIKNLDELPPSAIRTILTDLAGNQTTTAKNFLKQLSNNKELVQSYKKVYRSLGIKHRTNIQVLTDIANNKSPIPLQTINHKLLGTETNGVRFVKRRISSGGIIYEGVFPDYAKVRLGKVRLNRNLLTAGDDDQMKAATKLIRKKLARDPNFAKQFTQEQIADINRGARKIRGAVWHHNERAGVMELIPESYHKMFAHDGGKTLWGAGLR